jgi:Cu(I)/Ag(I) efflux system membrane fusion protein
MMTSRRGFGGSPDERVTLAELSNPAREALAETYDAYLDAVDALADDNRASRAFERLAGALDRFAASNMVPAPVRREAEAALGAARRSAAAQSLEAARTPLREISNALIRIHDMVGHPSGKTYHLAHCPMAYDFEGADWIQRDGEEIWNPYFGSQMLHCGVIERELPPAGGEERGAHEH